MEEVQVCRICLVMGVKLYDLQTFPWTTYLEPVVGINPLSAMDLPPYACFECAMLLKKYYNFRERCLLGQSLLYGILQTNGKITPDEIKQVNRHDLNLTSHLRPHSISEDTIISIIYDETQQEIKNEPDEDQEDFNFKMDVKEEDSCDEFPLGAISSDDNEPLSLHKTIKEKKTKEKKKVKRGRKIKDETADKQLKVEITVQSEFTEPVPAKPKRGRPRKTKIEGEASASETAKKPRRTRNTGGVADEDVDLEEYCTIIKLSVEDQLEEISKRQQSSNYLNAPFQCNLCYKGFIDTHAWRHHVGKHDPSAGDIECPICKFRFKTKRTLQKHAANHEKKYACKSCSYVSKTTTQAKQHQRWHKGVTYKCQYCDEVSTKWTSYLSHVRIKHPSEFICGTCGYSFVSRLGLTMHRTMMHKQQTENSEGSTEPPGPYCAQCDVQFQSVEAYKRHMVTSVKHTQSNDFTTGCRVCGETFKSPEELRVHHRKEHARKRPKNYGKKPSNITWPAQCEHCGEEIPNAREYWTHFRRAHPDKSYPIQKNYVCDICGKSFRGNAFLVYHKRTHFAERAYKCGVCPKAFFNRTNLQMHEKTHSDARPYPCDVCFKAFKCKGALDRHYRSHTGVKPYECEVCGKAFGQSNSRKLHVRTVHLKQEDSEGFSEPMGPYCAQCNVKFKSQEGYKRHLIRSVKHSQSNLTCRICGETFKMMKDLCVHHRKEHPGQRLRSKKKPPKKTWPAQCEHCEEVIPNAREYFNHFRRAHPDKSYPIQKNYVCDICGKSFRGNAFLAYHKRTHFDERAYKCSECPKAFHTREKLQNHRRMHSDARPYSCDVCSQTFKCKGNLNRHVRSHTGLKPYECEVCGKGFTQSNSRKLHVRTVHLKQPAPYVSRARLERRRASTREGAAAADILASSTSP